MISILKLCNFFYKLATKDSFDLEHFVELNNIEEIINYAKDNLKLIGRGSSRIVFKINDNYCLKIALPDNLETAILQNKSEFESSNNYPNLTAKIKKHHNDFYWIIAELAKPLKDHKELINALNLSSPTDLGLLFGKFPPTNHKLKKKPTDMALEVSNLVKERKIPRDVIKSDSWGYTTRDNRLVLIDYGMLK